MRDPPSPAAGFHNLTPTDFLPKVQVVPSGSLEIAKLQQRGYAYPRP